MPEIIVWSQARALGLQDYFSGKPCKRGHVSLRTVSSGMCKQCASESNKAWMAENVEERKLKDKAYRRETWPRTVFKREFGITTIAKKFVRATENRSPRFSLGTLTSICVAPSNGKRTILIASELEKLDVAPRRTRLAAFSQRAT